MAVWVVVAVIAAIGNAGVPMGCYFLTLSLMSSLNVPVDLMGECESLFRDHRPRHSDIVRLHFRKPGDWVRC